MSSIVKSYCFTIYTKLQHEQTFTFTHRNYTIFFFVDFPLLPLQKCAKTIVAKFTFSRLCAAERWKFHVFHNMYTHRGCREERKCVTALCGLEQGRCSTGGGQVSVQGPTVDSLRRTYSLSLGQWYCVSRK